MLLIIEVEKMNIIMERIISFFRDLYEELKRLAVGA